MYDGRKIGACICGVVPSYTLELAQELPRLRGDICMDYRLYYTSDLSWHVHDAYGCRMIDYKIYLMRGVYSYSSQTNSSRKCHSYCQIHSRNHGNT